MPYDLIVSILNDGFPVGNPSGAEG